MKDILVNLKETWTLLELANSIQKQFHDYGPEGTKIFTVSGEELRNTYKNLLKVDFIGGGHHYVYPFIPLEEIWIDNEVDNNEQRFFLAHEMVERMQMKHLGKSYALAHAEANKIEAKLRGGEDPENVFDEFCKVNFRKPELQSMGRQLTLAYLGF